MRSIFSFLVGGGSQLRYVGPQLTADECIWGSLVDDRQHHSEGPRDTVAVGLSEAEVEAAVHALLQLAGRRRCRSEVIPHHAAAAPGRDDGRVLLATLELAFEHVELVFDLCGAGGRVMDSGVDTFASALLAGANSCDAPPLQH